MKKLAKEAASALFLLILMGPFESLWAQALSTVNMCGPSAGNPQGTNWLSLPSWTDLLSVEQICTAIPSAVTIGQRFPDNPGTYSYNCLTSACSAAGGGVIPEPPNACGSLCFCVGPGEGFEVNTSGPAAGVPINGCDEFVTLSVPFLNAPGTFGTLVSVPYRTFLTTYDQLGIYFGLPFSGGATVPKGTVTSYDCVTGIVTSVTLGSAAAASTLLVPGQAYRLRSPTSQVYTGSNPVACNPPNPLPAACPVGGLMVNNVGGVTTLTWNVPAGCPLPLDYQVARVDLGCLARYCERCAACSILTTPTTPLNTFSEPTPAGGPWSYWVSVLGGTWNEPGMNLCIDRDYMMSLGCP